MPDAIQLLPEGDALAVVGQSGSADGDGLEQEARLFHRHQSDVGHVGDRVPPEKVEDSVPSRIESGGETGPGHGGLGRVGGSQSRQGPLLPQAADGGKLFDPSIHQVGVHAVEAQDHDLEPCTPGVRRTEGSQKDDQDESQPTPDHDPSRVRSLGGVVPARISAVQSTTTPRISDTGNEPPP